MWRRASNLNFRQPALPYEFFFESDNTDPQPRTARPIAVIAILLPVFKTLNISIISHKIQKLNPIKPLPHLGHTHCKLEHITSNLP
jgi:hypothetical protein